MITEYAVPAAGSGAVGITARPDGALWFTEQYGSVARILKAGQTAALGLVGVDAELLIGPSARMRHMIRAASHRASRPCVHDVKHQGVCTGMLGWRHNGGCYAR